MLLKEKGAKKDAEPVTMGWDEAQAAIAAGTHVPVNDEPEESDEAAEPEKKPAASKPPAH